MLRDRLTATFIGVGLAGIFYGRPELVAFASGWIFGAHILRADLPLSFAVAIVVAWSLAFALLL
jgi:hypothetical protein